MEYQICIICLRTDRTVGDIDNILYDFHDEICGYGISVPNHAMKYCSQCVYLLKKFYKFQRQCIRALEVFGKWLSAKQSKKQPLSNLYTLLPPSSLGAWTSDSRISVLLIQNDLHPLSIYENMGHETLQTMTAGNVSEESQEYKLKNADQIFNNINEIKNSIQNTNSMNDHEYTDVNKTKHFCSKRKNKRTIQKESIEEFQIQDNDTLKKNECDDDIDDEMVENNDVVMKNEVSVECDAQDSCEEEYLDDNLSESLVCNDTDNDDTDAGLSTQKDRRHRPMDIASAKEHLAFKFSFCGNLLAKDGTPIDKHLILRNFPNKVLYHDLRSLCIELEGERSKSITNNLENILSKIYKKIKSYAKYEDVFDIQHLSTREMRVEEFEKRKTYECYINAKHKCDICYTPFRQLKLYNNHMKTYHDESSEGDPCSICKMRLPKKLRHSHTVVFKCKLCPLVTYYRHTMKIHFGRHTAKVYTCDKCDLTYNCESGYYLHMSRFHSSGSHVCVTCGRGFSTSQGLTKHSNTHQKDSPTPEGGDVESVRCEKCDVTFPSQTVYDAHMIHVHEERQKGKNTRTKTCLPSTGSNSLPMYRSYDYDDTWKKTRVPHKFRLVKCRLCNTARRGGGWLKTHFKKEHPNENWYLVYADTKQHLCDICGLGFSTVYHLRDHMTLHTGARPFPCDLCPKKFRTGLLRNAHRHSHFPPTNLCTICGKKFKTKGNLFVHLQIHNGVKPYKCEVCGKSFIFAASLREHIKGVHYNIRRVRKRGAADTHPGGSQKTKEIEDESE